MNQRKDAVRLWTEKYPIEQCKSFEKLFEPAIEKFLEELSQNGVLQNVMKICKGEARVVLVPRNVTVNELVRLTKERIFFQEKERIFLHEAGGIFSLWGKLKSDKWMIGIGGTARGGVNFSDLGIYGDNTCEDLLNACKHEFKKYGCSLMPQYGYVITALVEELLCNNHLSEGINTIFENPEGGGDILYGDYLGSYKPNAVFLSILPLSFSGKRMCCRPWYAQPIEKFV